MPDDEDLRVILTPVQLAAVLQGASISPPESWGARLWNRVEGGATVFCGGLELVGSAGLLLTPEPTMVTKVAGIALGLHGSDTIASGMATIWTGEHHVTMTSVAVAAAARAMGYDDNRSDSAGIAVDVMAPILLTGVIGAIRANAVQSGRLVLAVRESEGAAAATSHWSRVHRARYINLDEEEALDPTRKAPDNTTPWGHTKYKHVGRTEAQLRERLANEPQRKAASSFSTIEDAERFIARGLITKASEIQKWAAAASVNRELRFSVEIGETVGHGVTRATNALTNMTKLTFRLRKLASQDRMYFLLTAYPDF